MANAKPCIRCTQSRAASQVGLSDREVASLLSSCCVRAAMTARSTGHAHAESGYLRVGPNERCGSATSRSLAMPACGSPADPLDERAIDDLLRGQLRQRGAKRHVGWVGDGER